MDATIQFICPHCQKQMKLPASAVGKQGKCPQCGQVVTISRTVHAPVVTRPAAQFNDVPAPHISAPLPSNPPTHVNPGVVQPGVGSPIPVTAIQVNVKASQGAHSLGIASIVLGVISLVGCWLPFIGLFLGGIGVVLGGIGLVLAVARSGSGIGFSIAGSVISLVGVGMGVAFMFMVTGTIASLDEPLRELGNETANPAAQAQPPTDPEGPDNNETSTPLSSDTPTNGRDWTLAATALQLGDVQIKISSVAVGNVPLWRDIADRDGISEDVLLTVWLDISNTSQTKKIDYRSWMSDYASLFDLDVSLVDNYENDYAKVRFSSTLSVKGAVTNESIYPGKSIKDAVVFEQPIEGVEYLRLKLSGNAFNEDGEFKFQIPADMIEAQENPIESREGE